WKREWPDRRLHFGPFCHIVVVTHTGDRCRAPKRVLADYELKFTAALADALVEGGVGGVEVSAGFPARIWNRLTTIGASFGAVIAAVTRGGGFPLRDLVVVAPRTHQQHDRARRGQHRLGPQDHLTVQ